MAKPTITPLPVAPSRSDPATFQPRADAFLAAFPQYRTELQAVIDWLANEFYSEVAAGTAVNPTLRSVVDADTGFYFPAAGQIAASVNAVRKLLLSSTSLQIDTKINGTAVTQSPNDSTPDRLLKVGDAGLLATNAPTLSNIDVHSIPAGIYQVVNTTTLGTLPPVTTAADVVLVLKPASNQTTQIYFGANNNAPAYFRKSTSNTGWSPWVRFLSDADITQSKIDKTIGRLIKVGDFGIGADAPFVSNIDDVNLPNGDYYTVDTDGTISIGSFPSTPTSGFLRVTSRNSERATQVFTSTNSTLSYWRYYGTSGWSEWMREYTSGTILGIVSQSGGVPTGAIIQRGSNANGEFIRFADGTQICWHLMNSISTGVTTWNFPAAFIDANVRPSIQPASSQLNVRNSLFATAGNTSMGFNVTDGSNRQAVGVHLMAVGRWY